MEFFIIFKHYITLSQSMLSIFKGINPNAKLYDLQHGIIHNNKKNYLVNGVAESNLLENNANVDETNLINTVFFMICCKNVTKIEPQINIIN